jgi:cell shape-determining protein MreD
VGALDVSRALLVVTLVTLFVEGLQLAVFSTWRVDGVVVMAVWLWPLAMGLAGYTTLGIWSAIVAGVFFDTHATTPFGLTAVVGVALAYGASRLGREGVGDLDSAAWWVTPVLAGVAGLVAPVLYVALGAVALNFGLWRGSVLTVMVVNALAFAVVARPVTRLARAVGRLGGTRR